jgi:hypothetical protein
VTMHGGVRHGISAAPVDWTSRFSKAFDMPGRTGADAGSLLARTLLIIEPPEHRMRQHRVTKVRRSPAPMS